MNIFEEYKNKIISIIKKAAKDKLLTLPENLNGVNVDSTPPKIDFDISTNVSMVLAKINSKSPNDLAQILIKLLKNEDKNIDEITFAKPGFINIKFNNDYWNNFVNKLITSPHNYGSSNKVEKKYLVEFVSANPTGPLHVGHCRGAILGDVISNVLQFNQNIVEREYYVNDYGNQVSHFNYSVYLRIREKLYDEKFPLDNPDLYPGDYLIDIANSIIKNNKDINFENFKDIKDHLKKLSINESLNLIKNNLNDLGIKHDNFISETTLVNDNEVEKVIEKLKKTKHVYTGKIKAPEGEDQNNWTEREQLLFRSTDFGDDKDRALQKSDLTWTYFASDVAYHNTKINRNFDKLINILGADHAGYIKRITSVVEALSGEKNKLSCKVSQLVKLIKDGKPFKMSKRKGDYITVQDLIEQVGKDATRFIMLSRSNDVELDFDFSKVKEKSKDNPLYYVQYCYARICSVFRNINLNINEDLKIKNKNYNYTNDEIKILKKVSEWPRCLETASNKLEPHRIPVYLYELSSEFHSYWNKGKDDVDKRFIDKNNKISDDKLVLLKIVSIVIKLGMKILGVNTPEKM